MLKSWFGSHWEMLSEYGLGIASLSLPMKQKLDD
jgi:hypothetical protein